MDWYRTSRHVRTAKHLSPHSHWCHLCRTGLRPADVTRNDRHHFPWGIVYRCGCGESGIWTNSVRDYVEFVEGFTGQRRERFTHGFCNDLYCPVCYNWVLPLKTPGMFIRNTTEPVRYNREEKVWRADDGKIVDPHMVEGFDIYGCRSQKHNTNIVWRGYKDEYGEGEYEPIYKEYFRLRRRLPDEFKAVLREAWEKAERDPFPIQGIMD